MILCGHILVVFFEVGAELIVYILRVVGEGGQGDPGLVVVRETTQRERLQILLNHCGIIKKILTM